MRMRNGRYECANCGAVLTIPTDAVPMVVIKVSSGSETVRTISYRGTEVHRCPLRTAKRQEAS